MNPSFAVAGYYAAERLLNCLCSFPNSHGSGARVIKPALSFNCLLYVIFCFVSRELQLPLASPVVLT